MSKEDSIWHPFTQMKLADPPLLITKATGTKLFTSDGLEIIDAISSWWVNIHGHAHPHIARRIAEQAMNLEHVIFAGFTHPPAQELASRLLAVLAPDMKKVFFSDNGSTSVEVALKMALQFWHNQGERKRIKILALEDAYHGDTFGSMSVGGRNAFNAAFEPLLFEVRHIPVPTDKTIDDVLTQVRTELSTSEFAAFIFEPLVQGSGGMKMHSPAYLDLIISEVRAAGVIVIADEVMTGFGRTGKLFATDYLKHKPDIMCLSKGITGGFMPLGVTVCSDRIYEAFYSDDRMKTFFHGHSYTANPLACAAANASLDLLLTDHCKDQIRLIVARNAEKLNQWKSQMPQHTIRQQGTILAIELATGEGTSYFNPVRNQLYRLGIERGVLIRPLGNVIYLLPPYCITDNELDKVYAVMEEMTEYVESKF